MAQILASGVSLFPLLYLKSEGAPTNSGLLKSRTELSTKIREKTIKLSQICKSQPPVDLSPYIEMFHHVTNAVEGEEFYL